MKKLVVLALLVAFNASGLCLAQVETKGIQAAGISILEDAREQYLLQNNQETLRDLRAAKELLKTESARYPKSEWNRFDQIISGIDQLVSQIQGQKLKTIGEFDAALAALIFEKAKIHASAMKAFWKEGEKSRASEEVIPVAHAIMHVNLWALGSVSKETRQLVDQVIAKSKDFASPGGLTAKAFDEVVQLVDQELNRLSEVSQPKKASH